ncbi:MAG: hypothetical protein KDA45_17195, partial [Planctomycetales bacterium]|nr:hypothetical protein [Planctomycetales bacterium]
QEAPGDDAESKWTNLERLWLWDRAHFAPQPPTLVSSWLRRTLEKLSSQGLTAEQLTALGEIASGFGDSELALELLTVDLTEANGDPNAINIHWLDAARIHTQRGMPHKALPLLADVRQSGSNTQRAFVQEVEALLLSGQYQKAEAIDQARWLRPLATTQFYQGANYLQIAREFSDAQQWESAQQYAEPAFWLADSGSMDIYWSAGRYSQILEEMGDRERAADVHRAALVEALQPYASSLQWLVSNDYYSSLRYAAQRDRLCRAVAAIEASDFATARHNIAVGRQLQPQDIEMVVQCYPRLQAAGQSELAQQLFDSYEQNMLQQLELWPQDATALNNLAWMYSQCDVKLDAALPLICRAVELAPSSAVFLDTLAEVEFRSGDVAAALETMRSCVRLDPREAHYRENLVRFRKR